MTDVENWPRVIQLAWAFYDADFKLVQKQVDLIKPDGWTIPKEKFWIDNGFDQAISEAEGIPISTCLTTFRDKLEDTKYLVAHNMSYDHNVVGAEFIRLGLRSKNKPTKICTKDEATDYCQIPGKFGSYKWPKLEELHQKLFDQGIDNAHDALVDVEACARCFFELVRQKAIILK